MALPVGASAPELPLGDLAAVFPSAALAGEVPPEAFGGWDQAFSLPIPEPLSEPPPLPEAVAGAELAAVPLAVASATPERWLAMARAQGALQVSAQPIRPLPVAALPVELQRPAEVPAPMPLAPVLASASPARAAKPAAVSEKPSVAVPNTLAEAVGNPRAAASSTVAVAVAPSPAGEPATGSGAPLPGPGSAPGLVGASAAVQAVHPAAPQPLPSPTLEARWGAHMVLALRESVQVQIQQRVQHASIRLDPPHLGSLQVSVSHEAGRVDVHISATQGDTARLLNQAGERLRQELAEQHPGQVSVSVSAEGQGRQPSRQPLWRAEPELPVAAVEDRPADTASHTARGRDVWVTV